MIKWLKKFLTGSRLTMTAFTPFSSYASQWEYEKYVAEGYQDNPYIFRAVNFLMQAVGSLEWTVQEERPGEDGKPERVNVGVNHPLRQLLIMPNHDLYLGTTNFMQSLVMYLLLGGIAPIIKVRNGARTNERPAGTGEVQKLFPVQPNEIEIKKGGALNPISHFKYTPAGGKPTDYQREDIVYLRIVNPLDITQGFPPLRAAAKAADMLNQSDVWNLSLLQNDCRPPGMMKIDSTLEDEQFEEGKRRLREQLSGASAGNPILADSNAEWVPFSYSPADMGWVEMNMIKAREVAIVFNVPPKILSETESQNYASLQAAIKQGIIEGALPLADLIKREFNTQLAPEFGENLVVDYDRDKIEALQENQTELWQRVSTAEDLTVNEKREARGYEAREDGDVVLVSSTSMPLEAVIAGDFGDEDDSD